ncbi:hypothetical protein Ahy_B01g055965 [Arachis hypogaea]|uniref:Aminotransferase-like plant mobile domain-containing protein n=1 Tax=Arachis hypogaea TaxID=3818 RepID=A0A445AXP5_ARAHY|nr:hypothetical protein Ahy_B01g055965 [Arachis hypogaea]
MVRTSLIHNSNQGGSNYALNSIPCNSNQAGVRITLIRTIIPPPTPQNLRENDPDSLRGRPERTTLLMGDDPARLYRLDGVAHIAGVINDERFLLAVFASVCGSFHAQPERCIRSMRRQQGMRVIPPPSQVQKYAVNCSWFQETFGECPEDANDDTVRRYVRAYIMMLLGTQLFADKSGNRIHIRWLPYVARLEELGTYSWGSAALAWLYRCMCRVANRHVVKLAGPLQLLQSWIFWRFPQFRPTGYETFSWPLALRWAGYNPSGSEKGPRVRVWRLRIDRLQSREFIWMPYSSPDVLQVLHPEVLEPRHMAVWRSVTALIYFAVIEWHQIDRVLPQFGGVQAPPRPALNIDFLMSKDGRGGDRWFPSSMPKWHAYWDARQDSVLRFDVVADPGPSHQFLQWWSQHGKRFLAPDTQLGDPRSVPIPVEASQWGPGRVPDMDPPDDVPDRRRVERRMGVGTRRSQRQWRWPDHTARSGADHGDDDDDQPGHVGGGTHDGGTSTHDGGHGGEWYGTGLGDGADTGDVGPGSGPLGDYFVGVPADDQAEQGGTPWRISGSQWADFVGSDSFVGDFGSPRFLDEITAIMQGTAGQTSGIQTPLDVDLNEPPSSSAGQQFRLGGTPTSAFTAASESIAGSSAAPLRVAPPVQPAP